MTSKKFTPFPALHTDRLSLRQLRGSDGPALWALRSNEQVNRYLDRRPSHSLDDAQHFIRTINDCIQRNESIYWALTLRGADHVMGTVCLFNFLSPPSTAEIGYELLPNFQGKGFMCEAIAAVLRFGFQHVGLQAIEAHTYTENHRSSRVLENLHFKKEGAVDENVTRFTLTPDS